MSDLAALAAIHAACFPDPWDAKALADLLATPGTVLVARAGGFILARAAAGEAEILTLAVAPDARRHGVATSLVREAASHTQQQGAEALFLEVACGNDAARALYAGLGFVEAGRRKAYYTAGRAVPEDALVLRANLPLPPARAAR
ncbi:MAG TPA: GNAT family N-acetyltransferase [Rhizomicrobium sp.]|nr:GNAT family N-acetyltransferase [Rhizomicrobium sp.]